MNAISRAIEGAITKELNRIATDIADTAKQNASWSTSIPKAISVGDVEKSGDGTYSVSISVNLDEETGAPHARAFEYGSGIHSSEEAPKKYIIKPKDAPALAFPFALKFMPRRKKLIGVLGIGNYDDVLDAFNSDGSVGKEVMFWNYVEHPGVEPKPYLRPAVDKVRRTLRGRLLSLVSKSFRDNFIQIRFIK